MSTKRGISGNGMGETAVLYALMLTYAAFTTLIGAALTRLVVEFAIPMTQGGIFVSVQNTGCFVGVLLSGFLIDRYGKRRLILLAFGGLTAALLAVTFASTFLVYLALLFLAGLAAKLLDALLNIRIANLHPGNKGLYLTLLHCSYGVGSLGGPLLAGWLLDAGHGWRASYLAVGLICLALFAYYAAMLRAGRVGSEKASVVIRSKAGGSVLDRPMVGLCLAIMLYSGFEVGINNWLPAYLSESAGMDAIAAGSAVSVFWLGLIASRLACSVLIRRVGEKRLVIAGMTLGGLALAASVLAGGKTAVFAGAFASGALCGAAPPLIFTLAYTWHAEAQARASQMLFIAITVGAVALPWLLGQIAGLAGGLGAAMLANAALLVAAGVVVLLTPKGGSDR